MIWNSENKMKFLNIKIGGIYTKGTLRYSFSF